MKQLLLPLLVFLPMGGAILSYVAGRRSERARDALVALVCAVCLAMAGWGLLCTRRGETLRFAWEGFCGLGLHFSMEGFRAIYSLIACFMWLCTSLFSREYFCITIAAAAITCFRFSRWARRSACSWPRISIPCSSSLKSCR